MRLINHILAAVFVGAFTITMAWPSSAAFAADPAFQVSAGERQLFLDDVGIGRIENLRRTMHQPAKKGAVIRIQPGLEGLEQHSIQLSTPPHWDPGQKIWKCWTNTPAPVRYASAYWESHDGLHWTRPVIGQVEYKGSRQNNFIFFEMKGRRYGPGCVVYDATDPDPNRRYKSLYKSEDTDSEGNVYGLPTTSLAVSPDGIHWTGLDIEVPNKDTVTFSFHESAHLYIVPARDYDRYGRCVMLTTSNDFENWTHHGVVFAADERDQEIARQRIETHLTDPTLADPEFSIPSMYNGQVYRMGMFGYEGLYIGLPMMFYRSGRVPNDWDGFDDMELPEAILRDVRRNGDWTGVFEVQLACSRDLKNWKRLGDRRPFIGPSRIGSGAYDTLCVGDPGYPAVRGDELWFYYAGIKSYAYISLRKRDQGAICLAVLRRDGFISLDAGEQEGTIQTESFMLPGSTLFVNVDAPKGELRVDVLDGKGKVIAESEPLRGDLLREPVKWAEGDIAKFKGRTASLRFTLRNGQFYSYWLE